MKTRSRFAMWWPVCLMLLPCGTSWAVPGADDHANLPMRGIVAVTLVIDGVEDDLASYGLDRSALAAAASERLTQAGITVLGSDESARRPDAAFLRLRVRLIRAPYYFYLYGVNLALLGKLALVQDPRSYATVEIWSEGSVGAVQPSDLTPLRDLSLQLIHQFIAEHASQNPN